MGVASLVSEILLPLFLNCTVPLPCIIMYMCYVPILLFVASPVRCIEDTYQHKLLLETESDNMLPVFDSLNYLSLYPWRINNRVGREGGREGREGGKGGRERGRERGREGRRE